MRFVFALLIFFYTSASMAENWGDATWGASVWGDESVLGIQDADTPLPMWALLLLGGALLRLVVNGSSTATKLSQTSSIVLPLIFIGSLLWFAKAYAVEVPNTFVNGTKIDASKVNENFNALKAAINAGTPGPQGPAGPQGATGPQGPAGVLTEFWTSTTGVCSSACTAQGGVSAADASGNVCKAVNGSLGKAVCYMSSCSVGGVCGNHCMSGACADTAATAHAQCRCIYITK
jgi:hypothetical protein